MNRREVLYGAASFFAAPAIPRRRRQLALTIDDVNWRQTARRERLLEHLGKRKSILFAVGKNVDDPTGRQILAEWAAAGHELGNHTYSHQLLRDPAIFEADILRNEPLLTANPAYRRRFRFPALKEGDTRPVRDELRAFLRRRNYLPGAVTIDASDWYYNQRLPPEPVAAPFRDAYLAHLWDRAQYYDALAPRPVRHTLLLHYNTLNALFLGDVIRMFESRRWAIVSPEEAFADPIFQEQPDTVPAGESLLWALAKQAGRPGLRYPGEDGVYEKDKLDRLSTSVSR